MCLDSTSTHLHKQTLLNGEHRKGKRIPEFYYYHYKRHT